MKTPRWKTWQGVYKGSGDPVLKIPLRISNLELEKNILLTMHALINISENLMETMDIKSGSHNKKYACGIFVNFQKAFDTVNHDILL